MSEIRLTDPYGLQPGDIVTVVDRDPDFGLTVQREGGPARMVTTLEIETKRVLRLHDDYCRRNDQGQMSNRLALVTWLSDAFDLTDEQAGKVYQMMRERPNRRPEPYRIPGPSGIRGPDGKER